MKYILLCREIRFFLEYGTYLRAKTYGRIFINERMKIYFRPYVLAHS